MESDIAELRAAGAERARARPRGPDMARVEDLDAGGVPARLYQPRLGAGSGADGAGASAGTHQLLVYAHGGGWTIGSVDTLTGSAAGSPPARRWRCCRSATGSLPNIRGRLR